MAGGGSGQASDGSFREMLPDDMIAGEARSGTYENRGAAGGTDPAKLKRIVSLIANEGPWIGIGVDVKGQIYEGLLEKNASEG